MKINSVSTDSCEDGGGEEDCLDVVPVGGEALADGVDVVLHCIVHHSLVFRQQALHLLLIVPAGPGGQVGDRPEEIQPPGDELGLGGKQRVRWEAFDMTSNALFAVAAKSIKII